MKKGVVVCYSGGIDSTVLMDYYLSKGYRTVAGIFKYENPINDEYEDALYAVTKNGYEYKEFYLPDIEDLKVPLNCKNPTTEVPGFIIRLYSGWKLLMANILMSYASSHNCDTVAFGHTNWNNHFCDETNESFKLEQDAFNGVYGSSLGFNLKLLNPYYDMKLSESDVVRLGHSLNTKFETTMSCESLTKYSDSGYPIHCGKCHFCQQRKKRFLDAGVKDPTCYEV